ncbi:MAG: hypothetical protein AABW51_05390 [Nanoarchaeota archaeon]
MELEEIIALRGSKLLDANFFAPVGLSTYEVLYEASRQDDIPVDLIRLESALKIVGCDYLLRDGVFSISEVGKEIKLGLALFNNSLKFFYQNSAQFQPLPLKPASHRGIMKVVNPATIQHIRRLNMQIEKRGENNGYFNVDAYNCLSDLTKNTVRLIPLIQKKDIRKSFSSTEREMYLKFLDFFSFVSGEYSLEKDFGERSDFIRGRTVENRRPAHFQTDSKILASAFTRALSDDVIVISSDSDIKRMINFFNKKKHHTEFGIKFPRSKVSLYSDFGPGYVISASVN